MKPLSKPGIYGIFCKETDECLYVGQSQDIPQRWKQHLKLLRSQKHPRKEFSQWFTERGSDESLLLFSVLEEDVDNETMNAREVHWFLELSPRFFGKQPSLNEEWRHSDATRKKISSSLKENDAFTRHEENFKREKEQILEDLPSMRIREISKKYGIPNIALKRLVETDEDAIQARLRASRRSSKMSEDTKKKIADSRRGKVFSDQIVKDFSVLEGKIEEIKSFSQDASVSKQEAADLLGVQPYSLKLFCSKNKILFGRPKRQTTLSDEEVLNLYFNQKLSTRKIAEKANCSQPTIVRVLSKYRDSDERFASVKERRRLGSA